MNHIDIIHTEDLAGVTDEAAHRFAQVIRHIIKEGGVSGDGIARVVLTGGGAGIGTLAKLVDKDIKWDRVHIFFGDERNVAVSHPDSNEGQAREVLLEKIDIPEANIHGYGLGGVDLEESARSYENTLKDFAPDGFDLHLLGMGGEGHINSLFPHSNATKEEEKLVVAVHDSPKPPAQRVTLTLPAINSAKRVWLLVSGAEKAEAVYHAVHRAPALDYPVAGVEGRTETLLIVSADASSRL
ncbi:6-phosphogluconolactonase [Corynebacterium sp. sy039]|uniref:6-phosphogluconolactonase n=1 Tax=Corynebacterium sp. sy039 TaxID=2599641 RepID=UPI0011B6E745|nr:6-phosphogluconolactonase [Corynebacterium sp. sy039]QDZ42650.1 6-phosphogluconolactonase [Corynebacterium sp. sy039]